MNIKVGDKVRIKTEEELLAEGWRLDDSGDKTIFIKDVCDGRYVFHTDWKDRFPAIVTDKTKNVVCELNNGLYLFEDYLIKLPQTLDEYICGLPLEERAKLFVYEYPDDIGNLRFGSTVADDDYYTYDGALQATIEALKQPKE